MTDKRFEEQKKVCSDDSPPTCGDLLDDLEEQFVDEISAEATDLFGVDATLYKLHAEQSEIDVVYNEPGRVMFTPHRIKVFFEYNESRTVEPDEAGQAISYATRCWFSRKLVDDLNITRPLEGDVIGVWNFFFDIVRSDMTGFYSDKPAFESYICDLRRNEKFVPERRLGAENIADLQPVGESGPFNKEFQRRRRAG